MTIPKHLGEAAARFKEAAVRIDAARAKPLTLDSLQEWLGALTELTVALSDIQAFNNESVHEKLHEIAGRLGLRHFPPSGPPAN
jgi:hypothetical protein